MKLYYTKLFLGLNSLVVLKEASSAVEVVTGLVLVPVVVVVVCVVVIVANFFLN